MNTNHNTQISPKLSVIIPFYNEEESLEAVCAEVAEILSTEHDTSWELILVNDGSNDQTGTAINSLCEKYPRFKALHFQKNCGQSAALHAGILAAKGVFVATLDGDGQNDPADLPRLLHTLNERNLDMMCGIREKRADNLVRKVSSRIANQVRNAILKDKITDVGCSLRVFRRECFERVPFFRNAHRFFPSLFLMAGFNVSEMPVNHRVRHDGVSKYGGGINSRLWVGLADLAGVFWLKRRSLGYQFKTKD